MEECVATLTDEAKHQDDEYKKLMDLVQQHVPKKKKKKLGDGGCSLAEKKRKRMLGM